MGSPALPAQGQQYAIESAEGLRYVARQPILDLRGNVHGYELLFRAGHENAFRGDLEAASRTMIDNAVMFGLEWLTGGSLAFFNCTSQVLTGELACVLPPQSTILEILETAEPTEELIAACRRIKAQGFRIALDDFIWHPRFTPLVELADYIKVDFLLSDASARSELFQRLFQLLNGRRVQMLAEKVETVDDYRVACKEGFTLFQGYYFCRPIMMEKRKIPANSLFHLEILQQLHRDPMDLPRLVNLVKSDTSLTYRLLRLVNSAGYGVRQEVRSIHAAIVIVGENMFRRIATLAITSELNAKRPAEIMRMALVRAQFCELAARVCRLDPTEQYLLGMLSMLPAMMQVPMDQVAPELPLRKAIADALIGVQNPERVLLSWFEAQERGDWAACDAIVEKQHLNCEQLFRCYSEAVPLAENALRTIG